MISLAVTGQYSLSTFPLGCCITSVAASMAWQFPISLSLSLSSAGNETVGEEDNEQTKGEAKERGPIFFYSH